MSKIIVIAGTPGTGKSSIGTIVATKCQLEIVNLSTLALEKGFVAYYDEARQSYVVDEDRLVEYTTQLATRSEKPILVLTHYPEILPRNLVRAVFVLRTHPLELEKRLLERGWSRRKVNENVMAEILGVVAHNAINAFGTNVVYEIDTTSGNFEEIANTICMAIKGEIKLEPGLKVDWLSELPLSEVRRFEDYEGSDNY